MFRNCPACRAAVSDVAVSCPNCNALLRHESAEVIVERATVQRNEFVRQASRQQPRAKLRRVARYQRWVIYALLLHVFTLCIHLLFVGALLFTQQYTLNPERFLRGLILVESIVAFYTMVTISLLANEVLGGFAALFYVILIMIPIVSLIALAVLNHKTTRYLRGYGVHVGFFGVDPAVYEQW